MDSMKHIISSRILTAFAAAAFLWLAIPAALLAGDRQEGSGKLGRFRLDIYGGFSLVNPSDMNLLVEYDRSVQEFTYDAYFEYLRGNGLIRSWNKNAEGERKMIRYALPLGFRIGYSLTDFLAVSVGFQYSWRSPSDSLKYEYTRSETPSEQYLESLDFAPYRLEIRSYCPSVGIHYMTRIGQALMIEAFVSGGPLFAECHYESSWRYTWFIQGQGYNWETYKAEGLLQEDGSGTGISLEFSGRLSTPVYRRLDVFLESGYSYQAVRSLSGSGREKRAGNTETWEGKWGIKSETMTAPWGKRELSFPTNYKTGGTGMGDFRLDLSGFRLRVGLSWGF